MAAVDGEHVVRAAGGVLWRPGPDGPLTCLVHRPRYDDWSLPKGKLTPGEHPIAGAVREVGEETDVRAVPQVRLPTVRYVVRAGTSRAGATKTVDYWLMRTRTCGEFRPNAEVDALRWASLGEAAELVTHERDAHVLREAAALPPITAVVLLVRHTYAGGRADWPGPDPGRPLEATGIEQAHRLADLLAVFAPARLVAATPDRCRQTLHPLAVETDLPIEADAAFDEDAPTEPAAAALRGLAVAGREPVVVCSQGKLIPRAVAALTGDRGEPAPVVSARNAAERSPAARTEGRPETFATEKGTGWLLAFAGDRFVAVDRLVPAMVG